jgi:hypothetical protein
MPAKKTPRILSSEERAVLLSVHRLLKWKGLKNGADTLAQEAGLSRELLEQYTPTLAEKEWNLFQSSLEDKDKYSSEDESSSGESEAESESESESETDVDAESDTDVRILLHQR